MDEKATVLVIGDYNVGKSTLVKYQRIGTFCDKIIPTVDIEFSTFSLPINGKSLKIFIQDSPGMRKDCLKYERFVIPQFTKNAVIVFVYYKTHKGSFDRIMDLKQIVDENVESPKKYFLVGNKSDDTDNEKIKTEEGQSRRTQLQMDFFIETSAKKGTNVEKLFCEVASCLNNTMSPGKVILDEKEEKKGLWERFCDQFRCLF